MCLTGEVVDALRSVTTNAEAMAASLALKGTRARQEGPKMVEDLQVIISNHLLSPTSPLSFAFWSYDDLAPAVVHAPGLLARPHISGASSSDAVAIVPCSDSESIS